VKLTVTPWVNLLLIPYSKLRKMKVCKSA